MNANRHDPSSSQNRASQPAEAENSSKSSSAKTSTSLWQLMQHQVSSRPEAASEASGEESPDEDQEASQPLGEPTDRERTAQSEPEPHLTSLWSLMGASPELGESSPREPASTAGEELEDVDSFEQPAESEALASEQANEHPAALSFSQDEILARKLTRRRDRSRSALLSCLFGTLAIPLSALMVWPGFWPSLPATLCGFSALLTGLGAVGELRRSRQGPMGMRWAVAGLMLGTLGMFLGPLVFSPWGQRLRREAGRQLTRSHLERIGEGLKEYHADYHHFPAGGTWRTNEDGTAIPLHSWMTALLPYLGEVELYRRVNFDRPYNDPVNFPVMSQNVPVFWAAGADRRKIGRGFAVSHFAGLGGERILEGRGLVHMGIFQRNTPVARAAVIDGLSQTLIAGEVAANFSPWGEPGNWRQIGEGLNRTIDGFGNAQGTGALFLRADGSVRFFSNQTSPQLLRKLSTRDGVEPIGRE